MKLYRQVDYIRIPDGLLLPLYNPSGVMCLINGNTLLVSGSQGVTRLPTKFIVVGNFKWLAWRTLRK